MNDAPLSMHVLADWLEGRLSPEVADTVARQVGGGDERTAATVDWLRTFLDASSAFQLEQPPPLVRNRLRQHFRRAWGWDPEPPRTRDAERARKVFDSRVDLALSGVRGGGQAGDVVHLAFRAESADLVLDAYRIGDGKLRLDGQLLRNDRHEDVVVEATVRGLGIRMRTVDGDLLGRFSLTGVPDAVTDLDLDDGEVTVTVPLDLGHQDET